MQEKWGPGAEKGRHGGKQEEHSNIFLPFQGLLPVPLHVALIDRYKGLCWPQSATVLTHHSAGHRFCFADSSLRLWAIILFP